VPDALVRRLGQAAKRRDVIIEVNEKWACPSKRVVDLLADAGVDLTMSTDAHHEARRTLRLRQQHSRRSGDRRDCDVNLISR